MIYLNSTNTSDSNTDSTPKAKGKKSGGIKVILIVLIVICMFLLGKFVIAPAMMSGSDDDNTPTQTTQATHAEPEPTPETTLSSEDKDDIFFNKEQGTAVVHSRVYFMMDVASYAMKEENGIVSCIDYGYKDGVVKKWEETMYVPVKEKSQEDISELDSMMKSYTSQFESIDCCTVSYDISENYYTLNIVFNDVDKPENYSALYEAGVAQGEGQLNISACEANALAKGYIKY